MDKIQVEEMADFFSQKIIYEEISAILKGIYPSVRGYSVNPTEQLCKKMEFLPRSFNAMCQQWPLKQLQRPERTSTKCNLWSLFKHY